MNIDLLECKRKAERLVAKDFVAVMKELWEEVGYAELNLTSQNLRDKVTSLEKIMGIYWKLLLR